MIIQFFFFSYLIALILVPLTRSFALKFKITDKPNKRKLHGKPKALLGGLALYLTITLVYFTYLKFQVDTDTLITWGLMLSLVLVGIIDDYIDMNAFIKFIFQIIIIYATVVHIGGISQLQFEILDKTIYLNQWQGNLFMMIWIIALVNAFNLIDGLDGLATGAAIISFFTLIISTLLIGDTSQVVILLIIVGALLGFLHFNFYPSTIFLGDAGSMFIGYMIAIFSINEYKSITLTSLTFVFLIVFLPVLDVMLSFLRRKINGEKVYKPDALHFHHRLIRKGFTHQQSVLLMYLFMLIYAIFGMALNFLPSNYKLTIVILFIIYTIFIIEKFYLLSNRYRFFSKMINKVLRR